MNNGIFCKTVAKGRQAFYLEKEGKIYFLFEQAYRVSNKEFFGNGVHISGCMNVGKSSSTSVRHTLEKLPGYIKYIENEYGISVYNKTKQKTVTKPVKKQYKRERYDWCKYTQEEVA